ncbi:VOC family protein, partial [Actinomadura sp. HBU206391]|uniref:VOC family protein n=1 Tax=Actinomadura sp. HBU206391 TaxID=2731692 RepID=UPI001C9CCC84
LISTCADDQGMAFAVYQEPPDAQGAPVAPYRHGEICYLTIEVPDSARARAFFGAVLNWEFTPGRAEDGWGALIGGEEGRFMTGLHGGHPRSIVVPMYSVDDVHAAVERVRAAGGTATEPERQPYGITAKCVDDQGSHFYLGQLS